MTTISKYGVLLISGRRTHQEGHAAAFAGNPRCRLVAVADESGVPQERHELNRLLADDHEIPYVADLDEALSLDGVDIVSMCADVERRGRVAVRCAEAGKALYLDKPLAGTVEDAEAIADAVEAAGVRSQMYSFTNAPWARAAKEALDAGRVGDLRSVHAEVLFAKGKAGSVPEGTVRREKERPDRFTFVEAKREMFDLGVYAVALVHWLTGRSAESVFGITGNYIFEDHARVDVEDVGMMAIEMQGGISATVVGGRIGWMSHPKSGPLRVVLIGTKGTLTFDAWQPRIEVYNDDEDFTLPRVHPLDPMGMWAATQRESGVMPKRRWATLQQEGADLANDIAAFIDCLDQDREPEMNARAAAPLVEVLLAGYVSAARGEAVRLPLPRTVRAT